MRGGHSPVIFISNRALRQALWKKCRVDIWQWNCWERIPYSFVVDNANVCESGFSVTLADSGARSQDHFCQSQMTLGGERVA